MNLKYATIGLFAALALVSCNEEKVDSDSIQRAQQEKLLAEGTAQIGMPSIKNFREKRILKDILELRDQDGLTTYIYTKCEMTGELIYLGEGVGYALSAATQFTSPQKLESRYSQGVSVVGMPQADPNGLFSPSSTEGSWVLMKNPNGSDVKPVYFEDRIEVSPFKLVKGVRAEKSYGNN